jgi:DNA-binding transcriptional regulator LsrR (DeoR family)
MMPHRLWKVASGLDEWTINEIHHLDHCFLCQRRLSKVRDALVHETIGAPEQDQGQLIAEMFNQGVSIEECLRQSGVSIGALARALFSARDQGWLTLPDGSPEQDRLLPFGKTKSLLELLKAKSKAIRNVVVRQSSDGCVEKGSWDQQSKTFGGEVAPLLRVQVARASCVGVAWGRTVSDALSILAHISHPPAPRLKPLKTVATVAGFAGEVNVQDKSSASLLAKRLAEAINGDDKHCYTLHALEAFISFGNTTEEIENFRRHIARYPNYQTIFGGPDQHGVIHDLDAIVTSCGNTHYFNELWKTELRRLNLSAETLNRLTHGNIGGVLLEREDLVGEDKMLFDDIARRWTGISRAHYEQCALRDPGVILLAFGHNKADVVLKCVELNLVSELIIDEDLAIALWDKIDPQQVYPRTLEAVLCRQVGGKRAG